MSTRRPLVFFLVFFTSAAVCWGLRPPDSGRTGQPSAQAVVRFVSDGDTIILESGEKVRYAGIDAPEIGHGGGPSDCYAKKARKANSGMVRGKKIILRYGRRTRDHYGRLLAWVYLTDGTFVNRELVKSGNAWVYKMRDEPEMSAALLKAQREAIGNRAGLWGACSVRPSAFYFGNLNAYVLHRPECPLGRETSSRRKVRFDDRIEAFGEGFSPCRVCRP